MPCYCIRAGQTGPVKLGVAGSVDDAFRRLDSLQVAHYETLHLLRLWHGDEKAESELHARFADLRIRGEWFSFSRLMLGDVGLEVIPLSEREGDAPWRVIDVVRRLGGQGDAARLCGTSRGAVSRWVLANQIPESHWPTLIGRARELGAPGITEGVLRRMVPTGEVRQWAAWRSPRPLIVAVPDLGGSARREEWLRLRAAGQSFADIAKAYGVTRQRVQQLTKALAAAPIQVAA